MSWMILGDDVLIQEVDDELVILNLASEQYFALNVTARRFLEICRASASFDAAIASIVDEFGIEIATATRDLETLLDGLTSRGLLKATRTAG